MSKAFEEIVVQPFDSSFIVRYEETQRFTFPWHIHNEIEVVLVVDSYGKKYAGSYISDFAPWDLSLYGTRLPHCYVTDETKCKGKKDTCVKAFVLQLSPDYFRQNLLSKIEFKSIAELIRKSSQGINFTQNTAKKAYTLFKDMLNTSGMDRYILLLRLFNMLANESYSTMSAPGYEILDHWPQDDRLSKVYHFSVRNYHKKITTSQVASHIHMSKTSFCRFFKDKTRKTYSNFIMEIRIAMACNKLINQNAPIAKIATESGFTNLSLFNRQFKKIKGITPRDYRNKLALAPRW